MNKVRDLKSICHLCGVEFMQREDETPSTFKKRKFCGKKCQGEYISKHQIGKKFSISHLENIKKAGKKRIGRKVSKETCEKISKLKKGITPKNIKQIAGWNKGKKGLYIPWNKGLKGYRAGALNNRWRGGITKENIVIRNSTEYKLWRNAVFARDGYTCQKCSVKRIGINAHHILNFSSHPELRFAIDNGITFCKDCHKEFHKIYSQKDNNIDQVIEFKNK